MLIHKHNGITYLFALDGVGRIVFLPLNWEIALI